MVSSDAPHSQPGSSVKPNLCWCTFKEQWPVMNCAICGLSYRDPTTDAEFNDKKNNLVIAPVLEDRRVVAKRVIDHWKDLKLLTFLWAEHTSLNSMVTSSITKDRDGRGALKRWKITKTDFTAFRENFTSFSQRQMVSQAFCRFRVACIRSRRGDDSDDSEIIRVSNDYTREQKNKPQNVVQHNIKEKKEKAPNKSWLSTRRGPCGQPRFIVFSREDSLWVPS